MNSADRHSLQFAINKIVCKIFGAMSKDLYIEISAHFGIESVENLIADMAKQTIIYVKCCADCSDWFICRTVFFIYCVCLIYVC